MKRSRWTYGEIVEFRIAHEALIVALYTGAVLVELRRAREKWLRGSAPIST